MPAKKKAMPRTAAKKAVVLPKKKAPAKKATASRRPSNRSSY